MFNNFNFNNIAEVLKMPSKTFFSFTSSKSTRNIFLLLNQLLNYPSRRLRTSYTPVNDRIRSVTIVLVNANKETIIVNRYQYDMTFTISDKEKREKKEYHERVIDRGLSLTVKKNILVNL